MWVLRNENSVLSFNLVVVEEYVVTEIDLLVMEALGNEIILCLSFLTGLCFFFTFGLFLCASQVVSKYSI